MPLENKFFIVVDTNIVKDGFEYGIRKCRDETDKENLSQANQLFGKIKLSVLLCFDEDETNSKIMKQYKDRLGKDNMLRFMIKFYQNIFYFSKSKLNKLDHFKRKKLG